MVEPAFPIKIIISLVGRLCLIILRTGSETGPKTVAVFACLPGSILAGGIYPMSRRNLSWLLGIAAVSLFGFAVTYSAPTSEKDKDYELIRLLVDVLHEVRHK